MNISLGSPTSTSTVRVSVLKSPTSTPSTAGNAHECATGSLDQTCITDAHCAHLLVHKTPSSEEVRGQLQRHLLCLHDARDKRLRDTLTDLSIEIPTVTARAGSDPSDQSRFQLNQPLQAALTKLVVIHGYSIPELVELVRGQTRRDYRPNKALCPRRLARLLQGYVHCDLVCSVASEGITPSWNASIRQPSAYPKNHQSANRHLNALVGSVRSGQDGGQYLVLTEEALQYLPRVHFSPLGAVAKKDRDPRDEVRLIHDLSYPPGFSVNDASIKACFPPVEYRHVAAIARRIEVLSREKPGRTVYIMKGDVKAAFRHLMLSSAHVYHMGARIPQLQAVILDMSAPFGWSGSPSYYGAFGGAISWLLAHESPASIAPGLSTDSERFFAYEWVDDHILVENASPLRLKCAEEALRLAMLAVLGPNAINDSKFTSWSTDAEVLGLIFDTRLRTVSMPSSKLLKALKRVRHLVVARLCTRHDLDCLLGSLRHVCCCLRAAKPFFQRVHTAAKRFPRRGRRPITAALQCDLEWFEAILTHGHWSGLPLSMFGTLPPPDIHIYMDSSDQGLAVLDPANHRYIHVRYDEEEQAAFNLADRTSVLDINARELFCAALAAVLWGPTWRPQNHNHVTHVQAWSDNMSAVSWINKLASDNIFAQELVRAIGLSEAVFQFRMSARHLPGASNVLADAGSRAWDATHGRLWTNTVLSWTQTQVPPAARKLYKTFSCTYSPKHWPREVTASTWPPGDSGLPGVKTKATHNGSPAHVTKTQTNSSISQSGVGLPVQGVNVTQRPPFCPRLATLAGFIDVTAASQSVSTQDTNWHCKGCNGCRHLPPENYQCPPTYSVNSAPTATSTSPMIAFSGGLRSWAISTCYENRSIYQTEE